MRMPHVWQQGDTLEMVEMDLIKSCLRALDGNVARTSSELGIARSTLYKRLKKVGLSTQTDIQNWLARYGLGG